MDGFVCIGKVERAFGVRGDLRVRIEDQYLDDFIAADVVFLSVQGRETPFFTEEIQMGNDILLKLEEVDSREAAQPLVKKDLLMRVADLRSPAGTESMMDQPDQLVGFTIEDEEVGTVGVIEEVIELPRQILAVVFYGEKEILVPLHEDLILDSDLQDRKLAMRLPEGLLEL